MQLRLSPVLTLMFKVIKSKVSRESGRRTRDLNHKITRIAVSWCIEHDVGKLVVGDVSGISKNTKNEKRLNKKNRQKISQWSFYQQRQYLEYKCNEVGILTSFRCRPAPIYRGGVGDVRTRQAVRRKT